MKVAILGSGNIGTDLLIKVLRSPYLECALFIGRNLSSPGMAKANSLGVPISDRSIDALIKAPDCCELVFDCTSALDHKRHWAVLEKLGKRVIDLTPSVPAVNLQDCLNSPNVNMVSCGGQTSIPLAFVIGQVYGKADYIEVVSSIASRSAGPATRINIDEYVETTEQGLSQFSGCPRTKVILNLNPAQPCINMQTTLSAQVREPNLKLLTPEIEAMIARIRTYVPGYELLVPPTVENNRIAMMVKVQGLGDYLPKYAGNLDIINCAALATAEAFAQHHHAVAPKGVPNA
ncbi:MAG: acetaldehyde dehydrogenase (acetylating) [Kiritimatiellaeota bacterium]|nr:acetaldehyde dehydrogenase (acetylating) [Kiritimatiellota bacterium]